MRTLRLIRQLSWSAGSFVLAACVQQQPHAWPALAPVSAPLPAAPYPTPLPVPPAAVSSTTFIHTPWHLVSDEVQPLPHGAELHEMRFSSPDEGTVDVSVARFDSRSCTLRILDQQDPHAGSAVLTQLMQSISAIAGVNGGYFHPDFSPLGLFIVDGQQHGTFTRTSLVSGMVCIRNGEPALIWNAEHEAQARLSGVIQCGPRLVTGGEPISGLNAERTSARSFVAHDGAQGWLIGVARYTSLRGIADLLATPGLIAGMRIQRALNLDGGRSTAFYAKYADGSVMSDPGWSTVRNYLAVIPR